MTYQILNSKTWLIRDTFNQYSFLNISSNLNNLFKSFYIIILSFFPFILFSQPLPNNSFKHEICGRNAVINYQNVLVDTSSTLKGEGLRYYLERDPVSKKLLQEYQEGSGASWKSALVGTAGMGMILSGAFIKTASGPDAVKTRELLIIGGISTLLANLLIFQTLEASNEAVLQKAIFEYNKRNLPKIYFGPIQPNSDFTSRKLSAPKNISFGPAVLFQHDF